MSDIEDIIPVRTSQIISVSRRTDVPAFYMKQLIKHLETGYIDVPNPRFPNNVSRVSLSPEDVKGLVWWSKDYSKWIKKYEENKELFDKYKHVFNFTINGYDKLEKGVASSLDERLEQLKYLSEHFGIESIKYRFDPIVFYKKENSDKEYNNLKNFEYIMQHLHEFGIKACQFAFCLHYKNVVDRMKKRGKTLVKLSLERKQEILDRLIEICDKNDVELYSCCSSELLGYKDKIKQSSCVDKEQIELLIDGKLKIRRKDYGQRKECGCVQSRDIGTYDMKCGHSCDYCYANPE